MPMTAPTSGSMFRNAPATSAETLLWPKANSAVGPTVPASTKPTVATSAAALTGPARWCSVVTATGSTKTPADSNCNPVTATGSRPRSMRAWETVKPADTSCATSTRPSPPSVDPVPWPLAMKPTPASDRPNPAQAAGLATLCLSTAAMIATSTGVAPISSAAWVTLVRWIPRFCSSTEPPYPRPPLIRMAGLQAARSRERLATIRMAAASANLANASQAGGIQPRASLDSGTVVPHRTPAAIRAEKISRRLLVMHTALLQGTDQFGRTPVERDNIRDHGCST